MCIPFGWRYRRFVFLSWSKEEASLYFGRTRNSNKRCLDFTSPTLGIFIVVEQMSSTSCIIIAYDHLMVWVLNISKIYLPCLRKVRCEMRTSTLRLLVSLLKSSLVILQRCFPSMLNLDTWTSTREYSLTAHWTHCCTCSAVHMLGSGKGMKRGRHKCEHVGLILTNLWIWTSSKQEEFKRWK